MNATATDPVGVTSVTIQRAPAGTSTWTTICTDNTSAYSCAWTTTGVTDGLYDLRATAVDTLGRTSTSTVIASRRVDNTVPTGTDVQAVNGTGTLNRIDAGDVVTFTYSEDDRPGLDRLRLERLEHERHRAGQQQRQRGHDHDLQRGQHGPADGLLDAAAARQPHVGHHALRRHRGAERQPGRDHARRDRPAARPLASTSTTAMRWAPSNAVPTSPATPLPPRPSTRPALRTGTSDAPLVPVQLPGRGRPSSAC